MKKSKGPSTLGSPAGFAFRIVESYAVEPSKVTVHRKGGKKKRVAWSTKDIPRSAETKKENVAGLLVIDDLECESILPHQMSDDAIMSMDAYADAQRGKPTVGSIRKL